MHRSDAKTDFTKKNCFSQIEVDQGVCVCVCVCVHHVLSWRYVAREDMLVHRVHSRTVYSIRERAFLILGELRHPIARGAAETCDHTAQSTKQAAVHFCTTV